MKWFSFGVTPLLMAALLGGGVGCKKEDKATVTGKEGKKLGVKAPDTTVKQGETAWLEIIVIREKFDDSVPLKFTGLPEGVTIVETDPTVAKNDKSVKLTLKATSEAKPVEDHKVTVMASGGDMKPEATFKVSIKKGSAAADTKSVSVKVAEDTTVKQGGEAKIKVTITREKFEEPVTLKFTDLPEGVSIVETDMTIAKADKSAEFTLKAAADAKAMDDHKVTVTASSGTITNDATFKVSVKKK
jgi:uncharacterized membrane protein